MQRARCERDELRFVSGGGQGKVGQRKAEGKVGWDGEGGWGWLLVGGCWVQGRWHLPIQCGGGETRDGDGYRGRSVYPKLYPTSSIQAQEPVVSGYAEVVSVGGRWGEGGVVGGGLKEPCSRVEGGRMDG